jgi:competence protein ComEC
MRKMLASALFLLLLPILAFAQEEEVKIVHFGVGHGDCTLIIVKDYDMTDPAKPRLQTISTLIDTGEQENGEGLWNAVWPYIKNAGGKRLDYLIISHLHKDHVGGAGRLLEYLEALYQDERKRNVPNDQREYKWFDELEIIDRLSYDDPSHPLYAPWDARAPVNGFVARYQYYSRLHSNKTPPQQVFVGTDIFADRKLRNTQMRCVAANGVVAKSRLAPPIRATSPTTPKNENDLNFAFLLRVGNFRYFTGGDLTGDPTQTDMETPLIKEMNRAWTTEYKNTGWIDKEPFHVCALKVGHHGSRRSSNGNFIDYLKPYMAVIEAGHRRYRSSGGGTEPLPKKEVIGRFLGAQQLDGITWRNAPPPLNYNYDIGNRLFFTYTIKRSPRARVEREPREELGKQNNLANYLNTTYLTWDLVRRQDIILSVRGKSLSVAADLQDAPVIEISRLRRFKNMRPISTEIPGPQLTCAKAHRNLRLPLYDGN